MKVVFFLTLTALAVVEFSGCTSITESQQPVKVDYKSLGEALTKAHNEGMSSILGELRQAAADSARIRRATKLATVAAIESVGLQGLQTYTKRWLSKAGISAGGIAMGKAAAFNTTLPDDSYIRKVMELPSRMMSPIDFKAMVDSVERRARTEDPTGTDQRNMFFALAVERQRYWHDSLHIWIHALLSFHPLRGQARMPAWLKNSIMEPDTDGEGGRISDSAWAAFNWGIVNAGWRGALAAAIPCLGSTYGYFMCVYGAYVVSSFVYMVWEWPLWPIWFPPGAYNSPTPTGRVIRKGGP